VTSDDVWTVMQVALDESNVPHDDYKVKEVMETWIKQNDNIAKKIQFRGRIR